MHTHSHSDHTGGDIQFLGQSGVKIVGVEFKDLEQQLGLGGWPDKQGVIDLGGQLIRLIPSPGLIRVKNWAAYKDSIQRLLDFSQQHTVSLILGAHIEFNAEAKKLYSVGQTYQPKEAPLALSLEQLKALNETLKVTKKAKKLIFDSFVISPLNRFERILVNTLSK